jgi:membrane protein
VKRPTGWIARVRAAIVDPRAESTRFQRALRYAWDLTRHCARQLRRHNAAQLAAALAYRTVFSLIPVLVLVLVVLRVAFGQEGIERQFNALLDYLGISDITVTSTQMGPPAPGEELATTTTQNEELAVWIREFVEKAVGEVTGVNVTLVTIAGVFVFLYAALSLLIQIESAFNIVVGAPHGRRWAVRLPNYWTLLTLGTLLLAVSFALGQSYQKQLSTRPGFLKWAVPILSHVGMLGATWLLLLIAYTRMPTARVRLRPAAIGALIGAILWELGKGALKEVIDLMSGRDVAIYGSLALVPLTLLWIHLTWLIVLFGLEVAYAIQTLNQSDLRRQRTGASQPNAGSALDPTAAVVMVAEAARSFREGECVDASALCRSAGIQPDDAEPIMRTLMAARILNRVDDDDADDTTQEYALARPPDDIRVTDVLDAVARLRGAPSGAASTLVTRVRNVGQQAFADLTIAQLLDGSPAGRSKGRKEEGAS